MYHTFHGRDLYAYTGARLARNKVGFEDVGRALEKKDLVALPNPAATVDAGSASGLIPALDINYGNVWTNIPARDLDTLGVKEGESLDVVIRSGDKEAWKGTLPFLRTFGKVAQGEPLAYVNSLDQIALALNMGSFAAKHGIKSGPDWKIELRKAGAK
jgi:S-adenosylmethionine hydrolase